MVDGESITPNMLIIKLEVFELRLEAMIIKKVSLVMNKFATLLRAFYRTMHV